MKIWNFFSGYVIIRVEGLSLEKFLNMAAKEDLRVFDARRISYTVLRISISASGYRKLKNLISDKYRVTVDKSAGVPFGFAWLNKRKALLFGIILIAAAVFVASLFVWDVRVTGVEDKEIDSIRHELKTLGVSSGVYKGNLDLDEVETRLIIQHEEMAWIDIRFDGVVVFVEIVPAEPIPEIIDENTPCNIVAKKDAYIESVTALCGRAAVKMGDTVRAGDVLISGLVWDIDKPRMLFAARGEVLGSVWYTSTVSQLIFKETREETGRWQMERVVIVGKDSARVDGQCTFAEYDTSAADEYYIGGGLFLPVKIEVLKHSEVNITKTPASLQNLKVFLEERAYYEAQAKIPRDAKIIAHKTFFDVEDDTLTATVYIQTQEDIGKVVYLEE